MPTYTINNSDGSVTLFTRDESPGKTESVTLDSAGTLVSRVAYSYDISDKMQEYIVYDRHNKVLKISTMSYGPGPWDARLLEFGPDGALQRRIDLAWDTENHCKTQLFYSPAGEFLGRALEKLDEDGVFRGLKYFDKNGNRIESEP